MSNNGHNIEKTNFDAFINAVGSEIQQAQVQLITAANAQMLFHTGKWATIFSIISNCTDGEAKPSNNWQRLSDSIIPKRKVIRNATLPICVSLQEHILYEHYRISLKRTQS